MRLRPTFMGTKPGFTLIEVILAVVIASGLLVVAISFYQRAARLRDDLLRESEQVGTIRLLLERMTADLRSACGGEGVGVFSGGSNSVRFIRQDLGPLVNILSNRFAVSTDLKIVEYQLLSAADGTNNLVLGLNRTEEFASRTSVAIAPTDTSFLSTRPPEPFTNLSTMDLSVTNNRPEPVTDVIRRLEFRYWNGSDWTNQWENPLPPAGVEIVLSPEPAEAAALTASSVLNDRADVFRRVVFIPAGSPGRRAESPMDGVGELK